MQISIYYILITLLRSKSLLSMCILVSLLAIKSISILIILLYIIDKVLLYIHIGIPFGYQIDVWSLGIVLMELIIGKPLFIVKSRTELYEAICMNISIPSRIRFAGGLYSELLDIDIEDIEGGNDDIKIKNENFENFEVDNFSKISSNLNSKINFSQHLLNINKILVKSIQSHIPNELIHFLAGLLHPDPDFRYFFYYNFYCIFHLHLIVIDIYQILY